MTGHRSATGTALIQDTRPRHLATAIWGAGDTARNAADVCVQI